MQFLRGKRRIRLGWRLMQCTAGVLPSRSPRPGVFNGDQPGPPRLSRTIYRSMEYLIRAGQRLFIPPGGAQSPNTTHGPCLSSFAVLDVHPGQTCILYALITKVQDCAPAWPDAPGRCQVGAAVGRHTPAPPAAPHLSIAISIMVIMTSPGDAELGQIQSVIIHSRETGWLSVENLGLDSRSISV